MGVTTTKTNKPLNPRAQDASPLAYNRAALYSGKALDFDGVNDYVESANQITGVTTGLTFLGHVYIDSLSAGKNRIFTQWDGVRGWFLVTNGTDKNAFFRTNTSNGSVDIITDTAPFKVGEWMHIACTYDGTQMAFYIDGQLIDTAAQTGSITTPTSQKFRVGLNESSGQPFDGKVTGTKVFDVALTAAQIADLYNNPEKIVPTGVANTALKLWLPMMESAGTTAFNGAADALGTEEVTNGDFATDSDWTKATGWTISGGKANANTAGNFVNLYQLGVFTIGKTYSYSFTITDYTQGSVRFTEAGNDISGQKTSVGVYTGIFTAIATSLYMQGLNDFVGSIDNVSVKELTDFGTISGATWTNGIGAPVAQTAVINWNKVSDGTNSVLIPQGLTTGRDLLGNLFENVRKQGALNLDGNSWAEVHDNASLDITDAITLELWYYHDTSTTNEGLLGRWSSGSPNENYLLNKSASDVRFYIFTSAATDISAAISSAGWYHVVGTYDGANQRIYLNGSEITSTAKTGSIPASTTPVEIGRYYKGPYEQTGQLAQPRIYNRALSAEEIQRNYNAGKNIYS